MKEQQGSMRIVFVSGLILLLVLILFAGGSLQLAAARGGTIVPLKSIDQALTPGQQRAQNLALASVEVQAHARNSRAEVFTTYPLEQSYPANYSACADGTCYQVDIYDFDQDATITSLVHVGSGQVLDVFYRSPARPVVNKRLYNLGVNLIRHSSEVEAALGFQPDPAQIRLMEGYHPDTACDSHLCGGAVFPTDSGNIWVLVDLTAETIAKIWWADRPQELKSALLQGPAPEVEPEDCGTTIHIDRDGWQMDYTTTPTDGLQVTDVIYDVGGVDQLVATRVKLVEWHAHYPGNWGFRDYTGCGGGGGGFPIYPYGNTQVLDLYDGPTYVGFEVVQDFRMSNWTADCNYRYEQHLQFFTDGRWRVVAGAYGRGCGDNQLSEATYRPVMRIDIGVDGDPNDTFAVWDGSNWVDQASEDWWLQSGPYTSEGYRYRVTDQSGAGYMIEPGQGQFGDGGTGDNAYLYLTLHKPEEGDLDLPAWPSNYCCYGDHQQGPDNFVDGEAVANENIVLWYVTQSETITTWAVNNGFGREQYCWTDSATITWPCFAGPMFVPIAAETCSAYDFDCNLTIDSLDIAAVADNWNCDAGDNDTCYQEHYDLNLDQIVNVIDVLLEGARWGCNLGDTCYWN